MTSESITVVRARHRRLAKLIHPDGRVDGYDLARTCDLITRPAADLTALARLLRALQHRADCAVVRGEVITPAAATGVRRLLYPDPATGDAPTLREAARSWLALDLDGLEARAGIDLHDIPACGRVALAALPAAFRGAATIVQASASHTIKPGLRLRLWCWLDRPTGGAELARWLRAAPVDLSVFRPVQPIYTAAPIFTGGGADPLPSRIAVLDGAACVPVPSATALAPPPPRAPAAILRVGDGRGARYAFAALTNAAARVRTAAESTRHFTIVSEARQLARFIAAGLLTEGAVCRVLEDSAVAAGKPSGEAGDVLRWAVQHPTANQLPEGIRA
jgi:hypothetical protein